jgi:hypothetical protein
MTSMAQRRVVLLGCLALGACRKPDRFWPALPPPADPRTIAACSFCPTAAATDFQRVARGLDEIRDLSLSPDGRYLLAVRTERDRRLPVSRRKAVVLIDLAEATMSPIFEPDEGSVYGPTWVAGSSDVVVLWTKTWKASVRKYRSRWVRVHAGGPLGPAPPASPTSPAHDVGSAGSADSAGSAPKPPAPASTDAPRFVRTILDRVPPPFEIVSETSTDLGPAALAPDGDRFLGDEGGSLVFGWMSHPATTSAIGRSVDDMSWSSDGQRVAYVSPGASSVTFLMADIPSSQVFVKPATHDAPPKALTSAGQVAGCPRFSPDGRYVAYVAYGPQAKVGDWTWFASNLALAEAEGGQQWRLTEGASLCSCPAWSGDGWLYVACYRDGSPVGELYRMHAGPVQRRPEAAGGVRAPAQNAGDRLDAQLGGCIPTPRGLGAG